MFENGGSVAWISEQNDFVLRSLSHLILAAVKVKRHMFRRAILISKVYETKPGIMGKTSHKRFYLICGVPSAPYQSEKQKLSFCRLQTKSNESNNISSTDSEIPKGLNLSSLPSFIR
jgi:hypothetical protein